MADERAESVVRLFAGGDPAATEKVRARVRRILVFRGYGMRPEEREEVEQSVTLELWQAVARPGFDARGFWGFVEVATARRSIDRLRARRREKRAEMPPEVADRRPSPLGGALEKEQLELARRAVEALPPDCRELLVRYYRQGVPYAELAAETGKSEGALRVQMHRCVGRARRVLREMRSEGARKTGSDP